MAWLKFTTLVNMQLMPVPYEVCLSPMVWLKLTALLRTCLRQTSQMSQVDFDHVSCRLRTCLK